MPLQSVPRYALSRLALLALWPALGWAANPAVSPQPPLAPVLDVVQTLHGVAVHDPYRSLEDLKNPATQAWLQAQGEHAERSLAAIEGRDELARRVDELSRATGDRIADLVRLPGNRLLYLKRAAGESQYRLVLRDGLASAERTLVDPAELAKHAGVPHAINYFVPSWDGKRVAYGLSAGGSEDASLYVIDMATGKPLIKPVPRVHESLVHWTPDSRAITYNQLRELPANAPSTETFLDTTVYLQRLDGPPQAPKALFGPLVNSALKLDRLDVAGVSFDVGSRFMIARTTDTTVPEGRLYVAPLAQLNQAHIQWRPLVVASDKVTDLQLRNDQLYLRTVNGAPRGKWLALDLAKQQTLAQARTLIDQPEVGVLQGITVGRDAIYSELAQGFTTRVQSHPIKGGPGQDLAPAWKGSTYALPDLTHSHTDVWLRTASWTEPSSIVTSAGPGKPLVETNLVGHALPGGTPVLEAEELLIPSHDGVRVPLALLHRADMPLDGKRPTLLIGYGAYGFSEEARFDARSIAWLEKGGVLAYANVRGSGAFGKEWHLAGFKATKPNTWKDGIAAAQYLVKAGITSPATLGVLGGSAGGIFVGRAITEAPAQFAAAISDVGMMDTIRSEESANGITNISEFGTVKDPEEFKALLAMSTYHQIRDKTAYPGVLLIHGMNDPRVDVWQSAKAAARLQVASVSPRPVLLRLDAQAGHGMGSTASQQSSKLADIYAFLLWQFGLAKAKAP
ncbi:MAG: S9 family peptidase [Burkholderiales bacterium]|nr:S9 family peptidase [Burkholderiales bacterium]